MGDAGRSTGRRVGRGRVLDAAVSMLDQADLADLLSFLGTRAVAGVADVRPATVHHHFARRHPEEKPNVRLATAVLDAGLAGNITVRGVEALLAMASTAAPGEADVSSMGAAAAANLRERLEQRTQARALLLAALAAPNDPRARAAARCDYERVRAAYAAAFELVAGALGRRFDTDHGWSAETTVLFGNALSNGLVLHDQYDPGAVDPELYGELCLRLLEAVTVPDDDPPTDPVTTRLLRRTDTLDLPRHSGLDQAKRSRIIGAVRDLYDRGGAHALTVSAVAREAGVSRGTVLANFGDRDGLAAAVWAQHLPELELRLAADRDRGLPLPRLLERHFVRVLDRCKADRELTAMLLAGMLGHTIRNGAPTYRDPSDPRSSVPLPSLIVPALIDCADDLWPGTVDTPDVALELAATITNMVMVRNMSRPAESASQTVERVLDLVLDGMMRRPTRD